MNVHVFHIIAAIVVAGLCLYANARLNPNATIKTVVNALIVCVFVLWLLVSLGLLGSGWVEVSP